MARKKTILDRREHIIRAAELLFTHYGYEKTTMEDISREAGIPRATIYLEFPGGKEDILMAHIERYLQQILDGMRQLAKQSRKSKLETLKQVILYVLLAAYDKATSNLCDPNNIERHSKRVRAEMSGHFQARTTFVADLLKQAAMTGEIPIGHDYNRIAELVTHGMNSYLPPFANKFSTREELAQDADAFFSLFLAGLSKVNRRIGA